MLELAGNLQELRQGTTLLRYLLASKRRSVYATSASVGLFRIFAYNVTHEYLKTVLHYLFFLPPGGCFRHFKYGYSAWTVRQITW